MIVPKNDEAARLIREALAEAVREFEDWKRTVTASLRADGLLESRPGG